MAENQNRFMCRKHVFYCEWSYSFYTADVQAASLQGLLYVVECESSFTKSSISVPVHLVEQFSTEGILT